jgi:hypothetical protein
MVAGGAVGNLLSMLFGPEGVADFLAVQLSSETTIVANVADLALWAGAAMLAPVALLLMRMARAERSERAMLRVELPEAAPTLAAPERRAALHAQRSPQLLGGARLLLQRRHQPPAALLEHRVELHVGRRGGQPAL